MDSSAEKDYYRILHLDRTATQEQIRKAFFTLAKKYHPDTKKSLGDATVDEVFTEKYREVNEAHEVLSDPAKRSAYDKARDRLEHGAWRPDSGAGSSGAGASSRGTSQPPPSSAGARSRPATPEPESEVLDAILPPVIRSDRGVLFLRRKQTEPYIGEDGARYSVTVDGRIRRLPGQGVGAAMDRYVVVGSPGEVALAFILRGLLRFGLAAGRAIGGLLASYPLMVSMLVIHPNPLRRLKQERRYIGWLMYGPLLSLCLLVLLAHGVLAFQLHPILVGVSFALHLLAAGMLTLELRTPYLTALDHAGYGNKPQSSEVVTLARRTFVAATFLGHLTLAVLFLAPLLSR